MHADKASAVVTSTPQAESLRAPSNHQDIRSRERTNQKCRAPRGYTTPQSNVTANEALVAGFPQDTCLRGAMSHVSGSEVREQEREFSPSLIREHRCPRRCSRLVRKPTRIEGRPNHGRIMGQTMGRARVNRRRGPTTTTRSVRAPSILRSPTTSSCVHRSCAPLSCPTTRSD
jgi:hypothetical protein